MPSENAVMKDARNLQRKDWEGDNVCREASKRKMLKLGIIWWLLSSSALKSRNLMVEDGREVGRDAMQSLPNFCLPLARSCFHLF